MSQPRQPEDSQLAMNTGDPVAPEREAEFGFGGVEVKASAHAVNMALVAFASAADPAIVARRARELQLVAARELQSNPQRAANARAAVRLLHVYAAKAAEFVVGG
jgi:hypothetical protein